MAAYPLGNERRASSEGKPTNTPHAHMICDIDHDGHIITTQHHLAISNESSAKKTANTRRKIAAHAKKIMQLHHEKQQQRTAHISSHRSFNYSTTTTTTIPNPNSRIEQWKSRCSELQSFINHYGIYDVLTPSLENGKHKSLCDWWN